MADYAINNAYVIDGPTASATAGGTITAAGVPVYVDYQDASKLKEADNDASAGSATVIGIALDGVSVDQVLKYAKAGARVYFEFSAGSFTTGDIVVLSSTTGKLAPAGDLGSGDFVTIIGVAENANVLRLLLASTGVKI